MSVFTYNVTVTEQRNVMRQTEKNSVHGAIVKMQYCRLGRYALSQLPVTWVGQERLTGGRPVGIRDRS